VTRRMTIVFVHGINPSSDTWRPLLTLLKADDNLAGISFVTFDYSSPVITISPLKAIPDYDLLAVSLETFLDLELPSGGDIMFVCHSQGGLIVQRFLAKLLLDPDRSEELQRIRSVVFFACPNSGSQIFATVRRVAGLVFKNPQERSLHPLDERVAAAQRTILHRLVYGRQYPDITLYFYAGESDNTVRPTSAQGPFPKLGVLPGDHFTVIQPESASDRVYRVLKARILEAAHLESPRVNSSASDPFPDLPPLIAAALRVDEGIKVDGRTHEPGDWDWGWEAEKVSATRLDITVGNVSDSARLVHTVELRILQAESLRYRDGIGGFLTIWGSYQVELPRVAQMEGQERSMWADVSQEVGPGRFDRFELTLGASPGNSLPGLYLIDVWVYHDNAQQGLNLGRVVVGVPHATPFFLDPSNGSIGTAWRYNAEMVARFTDMSARRSRDFDQLAERARRLLNSSPLT
jgi:Alpha/beta hydrolase family